MARLTGQDPDCDIYMAFNAWQDDLTFELPPAPNGGPWRQIVDTAQLAPLDFVPEEKAPPLRKLRPYQLHSFSMIVLVAEK